jgi:predicted DCC family thiol-disulfide oxidoreductase YuxK
VYDGDCRLCVKCVAIVRRWDRGHVVRTVPSQDGAALGALPARLRRAELESAMHLVGVDGAVASGAAAVPLLLRLLPGGAALALIFSLPGIPRAASVVYRWIARNRRGLACSSAAGRGHG